MDPRRRTLAAKIALTAAGGTLTVAGLAGLVLPVVPGLALLIPGLAILAGEYAWARHLLDKAKEQGERVFKRGDKAA